MISELFFNKNNSLTQLTKPKITKTCMYQGGVQLKIPLYLDHLGHNNRHWPIFEPDSIDVIGSTLAQELPNPTAVETRIGTVSKRGRDTRYSRNKIQPRWSRNHKKRGFYIPPEIRSDPIRFVFIGIYICMLHSFFFVVDFLLYSCCLCRYIYCFVWFFIVCIFSVLYNN